MWLYTKRQLKGIKPNVVCLLIVDVINLFYFFDYNLDTQIYNIAQIYYKNIHRAAKKHLIKERYFIIYNFNAF